MKISPSAHPARNMNTRRPQSHCAQPASTGIEILESRIAPARAFAILGANLVSFDTSTPGTLTSDVAITGLGGGETVVGMDFRPSTGVLYAVTIDGGLTGHVYTLNTASAAATLVSTMSVPLAGTDFGVDFNPVVDRLRVVSNLDQNVRVNVDTGLTTIDLPLNPGNPSVVASAYANSFVGSTSTTLFGIDSVTDTLVIQNPPNNGTITPVGALGVNTSSLAAFDISTAGNASSPTNTGFAVLTVGGAHNLYSINLSTGAATLAGTVPGATALHGFSLAPAGTFRFSAPTITIGEDGNFVVVQVERVGGANGTVSTQFVTVDGTALAGSDYQPQTITLTFLDGATGPASLAIPITNDPNAEDIEAFKVILQNPSGGVAIGPNTASVVIVDDEVAPGNAFALDNSGNLLRFNSAAPGTIVSSTPITGLGAGEIVLGMDFRPADRELYAVTNGGSGNLYKIDVVTGAATFLSSLSPDPADATNPFTGLAGASFGIDFNPVADRLRIISDSGQNLRVNVDTGRVTTDADLNPGVPRAAGAAYSNSFAGTLTTTLFDIDPQTDSLLIQNPPNNGTLVPVGSLGVDAALAVGFDIRSENGVNTALATLVVGGVTGLYSINTVTGSATLVGPICSGNVSLLSFSVAPTQFSASVSGSTAAFEGSALGDSIEFQQVGGLLKHNRFTAGDAGFNSDFDFDSTVAGDQTLSANAVSTVVVNGNGGNDQLSIAGDFLGGANFELHGGIGADRLLVAGDSRAGNVTVDGGDGIDTIDFSNSISGVSFRFDLLNVGMVINGTGLRLFAADSLENFVGTALNDTIFASAGNSSHQIDGGGHTTSSGDQLVLDAAGTPVSISRSLFNAGTVLPLGFAPLVFNDVESIRILNSPSSTFGGLGNPATAFTAGNLYDVAPAKGPLAVATGDVNGDGFADIVAVNGKSKNISVLLNQGNGTFGEPTVFGTGGKKPSDLVLGDFNADSFLDVAAINSGSGSVSLLTGDGAGSFGEAKLFKIAAKPTALTVGTVNGDTKLDLVVAHSNGTVSVLLGNGTDFAEPSIFKTGGKALSDVVLGDFNKDGFTDVVTANAGSNNISFLAGDGNGNLQEATLFKTGKKPTNLAVADLDLDGSLDVATVHGISRFVSVLYGRGSAAGDQFESQLRIGLKKSILPVSVAVGDISGDGLADLVLTSSSGATVHALIGLGSRSFSSPVSFDLGDEAKASSVAGLALADFNNDGLLDVATTVPNASEIRTLLRQPPA